MAGGVGWKGLGGKSSVEVTGYLAATQTATCILLWIFRHDHEQCSVLSTESSRLGLFALSSIASSFRIVADPAVPPARHQSS